MTTSNPSFSSQNHEQLAREIAEAFDEEKFLPVYRAFVRRYPREVVLRAYQETLEFPAGKIRKSKGAIFNYLLKKYAQSYDKNSWH